MYFFKNFSKKTEQICISKEYKEIWSIKNNCHLIIIIKNHQKILQRMKNKLIIMIQKLKSFS